MLWRIFSVIRCLLKFNLCFERQYILDLFFDYAMKRATKLEDTSLIYALNNIVHTGLNYKMLGDSSTTTAY